MIRETEPSVQQSREFFIASVSGDELLASSEGIKVN